MCFSLYVPVRKDSEEGETMKKVRVQDAVGMVLCHDMTEIVPGKFKGRALRKRISKSCWISASVISMSGTWKKDMSTRMMRRSGW